MTAERVQNAAQAAGEDNDGVLAKLQLVGRDDGGDGAFGASRRRRRRSSTACSALGRCGRAGSCTGRPHRRRSNLSGKRGVTSRARKRVQARSVTTSLPSTARPNITSITCMARAGARQTSSARTVTGGAGTAPSPSGRRHSNRARRAAAYDACFLPRKAGEAEGAQASLP